MYKARERSGPERVLRGKGKKLHVQSEEAKRTRASLRSKGKNPHVPSEGAKRTRAALRGKGKKLYVQSEEAKRTRAAGGKRYLKIERHGQKDGSIIQQYERQ